jgi:PTH1 family peptidyl-tRNA hydrolase
MEIAAVVGLGNPGDSYEATRHNLGFWVVDLVAGRVRAGSWERRYNSLVARSRGRRALLLVKPQTFMNLSGEALAALCRGEGVLPEQCLVVVDDVELPLGQLRLRARGGSGSHNGLRSIVDLVGEGFPRLRIGIRGEAPWADLAEYVLSPFLEEELTVIDDAVVRARECIEMLLRVGLERAACRYNAATAQQEDEP